MKAVIQRVESARLTVDGREVARIGLGLAVYLGLDADASESEIPLFCRKLANLRIFSDEQGKLNRSVLDVGGSVLLISQFTLCANIARGNRPDFTSAMRPEPAREFFDKCAAELGKIVPTQTGVFGADMTIEQVNIGPVTIIY